MMFYKKLVSNVIFVLLIEILHLQGVYFSENPFKQFQSISNINNLTEKLSDVVYNVIQMYAPRQSHVHFVLPIEKDGYRVVRMMEVTLKKVSNKWPVTKKYRVCCEHVDTWHIPYETKPIGHTPNIYVLPFYGSEQTKLFAAQLETMSRKDTFNPSAMFLLVQITDQCAEVVKQAALHTKIFKQMWDYHLYNTTLLIISECDLTTTVATAQPFSQENECRIANEKGISYLQVEEGSKLFNNNMFQYHTPYNFRGCVFWAGTVPYPPYVVGKARKIGNETRFTDLDGLDIQVLNTFSRKRNAIFKYYQTHTFGMDAWVTILENGTIIGIVQDLLERKIDITFGGVMPSYITSYKLDYSNIYKFSTVNFFVPDADIIPLWLIFLKVFTGRVWILSAAVYVLVSLVYNLTRFHSLKNIDSSLIELFKLCIGFSTNLNPKRFILRFVLFVWSVFSVHWYIAYSSMMFLLLTNPPHSKEILTFKDLKAIGLKVYVNAIYLEIFSHTEIDKTTTSILENHIICTNIAYCVEEFVKFRNASVMVTAETMEYLTNWQRSKIHKLPENILMFGVSFVTKRGNPLSEALSLFVMYTLQAGLLLKWERDVGWKYRLKNLLNEPEEKSVILDLRGAFYILSIGYFFSMSTLLAEFTIDLLKRKRTIKLFL